MKYQLHLRLGAQPPSFYPPLFKLFCGRSLVNPNPLFFFNGLKNFVTVDIFMMSVNKKDLLFMWLCGRFNVIQR